MVFIFIVFAFLGGVFLAFQIGVNAQLRIWTGHPISAALISIFFSFCSGIVILLIYAATSQFHLPSFEKLRHAPWWVWTGGILGMWYVWLTIMIAPRLGSAVLIGLIVAGQLTASLVIDHYGWVGFAHHPISLCRIFGAFLLISGVILIRRF
jgi:bacterial/archaeal transporter family-2 protein